MKATLPFLGLFRTMCCGALHAADARKPNVLFIAIDDMNDRTGFLGGQHSLSRFMKL